MNIVELKLTKVAITSKATVYSPIFHRHTITYIVNIKTNNKIFAGMPTQPNKASKDSTLKNADGLRVAEKRIDFMNPSQFHTKKGNETKNGMLKSVIVAAAVRLTGRDVEACQIQIR